MLSLALSGSVIISLAVYYSFVALAMAHLVPFLLILVLDLSSTYFLWLITFPTPSFFDLHLV